MAVTEADFVREVELAIRRHHKSQASHDDHFVKTLCNYVVGIVKLEPLGDGSQMREMLREFLEDQTPLFVHWLLKYISTNGKPNWVESRPSERQAASKEPQERNKPAEQRERSRSPGVARRPGTANSSLRFQMAGQKAVFQEAVRQSGGTTGAEMMSKQMQGHVKPEPNESPDIIVMSPATDMKNGNRVSNIPSISLAKRNIAPFGQLSQTGGWQNIFQQKQQGDVEEKSVVIMNVHFQATPEQLGVYFDNRCGCVVRVTILKNAHGMPKGYAYMELQNSEAASRAMNMSGVDFMGRTLKVVPKLKRPPPSTHAPPWVLNSMNSMYMFPYMMPGVDHSAAYPGYDRTISSFRHKGLTFFNQHTLKRNGNFRGGRSDVWIRGVSRPVGRAMAT